MPLSDQRKHELNELSNSFGEVLKKWVSERRGELVQKLIASENTEMRGAIKELDYLLGLPERLQQELSEVSQEEGGLTG